jgi:hypothetical protein
VTREYEFINTIFIQFSQTPLFKLDLALHATVSYPEMCFLYCSSPLPSCWFSWSALLVTSAYLLFTLFSPFPEPAVLAEFYMFDLNHMNWSIISPATGDVPSARFEHGFTAGMGKLYLFGGKYLPYARGNLLCMFSKMR